MAILVIFLAVLISVALFFTLALQFGRKKEPPNDVLDLNTLPERKEASPLLRDDIEDQLV
ncbi:MAG: hypothetical protein AAGA62_07720 [Bacteroidota bacterium]